MYTPTPHTHKPNHIPKQYYVEGRGADPAEVKETVDEIAGLVLSEMLQAEKNGLQRPS